MTSRRTIVGLGEVLWDLLPSGKTLGGAPTNFTYMASLFGHKGIVASRVGADRLGEEIGANLRSLGVGAELLQLDPEHSTGTASVTFDGRGQPEFRIAENVAWDFLAWTPEWEHLATRADAVCFGTLAQRSAVSRATIQRFLENLSSRALKIFDVNLRQCYFSADLVVQSLPHSDIVKLNHTELPIVAELTGLQFEDVERCARELLQKYALKLVCVTRGEDGSLLVDAGGKSSHPGLRVKVADAVGAGDAFTACLAHYYLQGASLDEINTNANRFAAWVASERGGTPSLRRRSVEDILKD